MARPTCRLLIVASSILLGGVFFLYRLSSGDKSLYSGRESVIDLNPGHGSSEHQQQFHHLQYKSNLTQLTVTITGKENATQGPAGQGLSCKRLWKNERSKWFNDRFKESLLPVWMKGNMQLDDLVAKWWMVS